MNATASSRRVLGVLPPLGGSLTSLAATGQVARLVDFYFPAYLEQFDRVLFFSSRHERLEPFTADRAVRRGVDVVAPPTGRDGRLADLARLVRGAALRSCSLLRALQAPGGLPALACRAPLVVTYGYSYQEVSRYVGRPRFVEALRQVGLAAALRAVLRRADVTLLTNPALVAEARRLGAEEVAIIPNGVPLDLFQPRPAEETSRYDVVLLGRLSGEKNFRLLARAAPLLRRPLRVCVVGDGPLREELDRELARGGCEADFLGTRPYAELPAHLRSGAVFVLPSSTEGRAKALLEAMACGLPCVVSDIPSFADLVRAGAVLAFPPDDERALAGHLKRLLGDAELRGALARAGRRYVEQHADLASGLRREAGMLAELAREGRAA